MGVLCCPGLKWGKFLNRVERRDSLFPFSFLSPSSFFPLPSPSMLSLFLSLILFSFPSILPSYHPLPSSSSILSSCLTYLSLTFASVSFYFLSSFLSPLFPSLLYYIYLFIFSSPPLPLFLSFFFLFLCFFLLPSLPCCLTIFLPFLFLVDSIFVSSFTSASVTFHFLSCLILFPSSFFTFDSVFPSSLCFCSLSILSPFLPLFLYACYPVFLTSFLFFDSGFLSSPPPSLNSILSSVLLYYPSIMPSYLPFLFPS